jgi:hypothetical protein
MNTQQLGGSDRRAPVLLNENTQLVFRVDAPRISACFYQRPLRVLVLAEKDRFLENL